MNGPVQSFSGPANFHLELTGLFIGNAGGKGMVFGCMGALSPSVPVLVALFGTYPALGGLCPEFQDITL